MKRKIKEKEIRKWIQKKFKWIRHHLDDLDINTKDGMTFILYGLNAYLDNLDINYIDRRDSRKKSIFKIADYFGVEYQCAKLEEELIECLHAIKRYNTSSIHNYDQEQLRKDLVEEMGDVRMMIMQVEHLLGVHDDVNKSIEEKIIRTFEKIDEEKKNLDLDKIKKANE